jgi:hypothetical protein
MQRCHWFGPFIWPQSQDVAGEIATALSAHAEFAAVSVARPAFVNMRLSDEFILKDDGGTGGIAKP